MKERSHPALLSAVRKFGTFNAHGCFNCGSCTIACDLAQNSTSFPRRTMQAVMLGLRDSVLQSLDPWLCHDCGDCSSTCPRAAQPQDSMMTLRRYLTAQYDWTGLASRICRSPLWEIATLSFAAALVLLLIVLYHLYIAQLPLPVFAYTATGMEHMFPRIIYFTLAVFLLPAFFVVSHAWRMYTLTMRRGGYAELPLRIYLDEAKTLLLQMVAHTRFLKCPATLQVRRWLKHWLLAFGCVLMFGLKFFFLRWFQTDKIYPLYHPERWLGYLGAACIVYGAGDMLIGHLKKRELGREMIFPLLLLLTAASGMAVHISRYAGLPLAAHYAYAVHLMIAVPMLLIEVPFGKWSHMIYRPMALYFAAVRARALEAKEEVAA